MKYFRSSFVVQLAGTVFLAGNLTLFAHEPIPHELKVIQERHIGKIKQADEGYLKALRRLEAKFEKRGDMKSASLVAQLLKDYRSTDVGVSDLCQIRVRSTTSISAQPLMRGVPRLSGGYKPEFSFIADQLEGNQFVRVPWRSKPKYEVEVVKSGYLYLFGVDRKSIRNTPLKLDVVEGKVRGNYVGAVYMVHVSAGQTFTCSGYETCLIADRISVQ